MYFRLLEAEAEEILSKFDGLSLPCKIKSCQVVIVRDIKYIPLQVSDIFALLLLTLSAVDSS